MTVEAHPVLQALGAANNPVRVSALDRICDALAAQGLLSSTIPREPGVITAGIGATVRAGWVYTDGVRLRLSDSGWRQLDELGLTPSAAARQAAAQLDLR